MPYCLSSHVKLNSMSRMVILGYFPLQILTMFEENYPENLKKVLLIKGEELLHQSNDIRIILFDNKQF